MADDDVASKTPLDGAEGGGRERWPSRFSFIMAAIGSAVGLGNVWRFPAVAYANGGGAFFIPYFVALLTAGIPLLILEFSIGQMMQGSAPQSLRKLNKNFEWVGWFALLVGTVISVYYAIIMAYSWNYLWYSVTGTPWSAGGAGTEGAFFENTFLRLSTAPGEMWGVRWPIVLGLALTWSAVFLIIYKGVHRVGKIVLVTVPLPWVILLILAIRGLTLEGASAGIEYYLRPEWSALKKPSTWLAAYSQIFFSLTIGFGVMIAYASYRPRKADVTNSAFITSFANCLTSFLAGFVVFSVLGFLAFKNGMPVKSVVNGGAGLAFVTYPAAITKMGDLGWIWPPVIGVLFFVALLTLGIDSLFSLVEAIGAGFHDRYPRVKRVHVAGAMCGGAFLLGLPFCMRGGIAWLDLFDHWANDYGLAVVGLLQCMLVSYFFAGHRIRDFANDVSEIKLSGWWDLCIRVVTPVVLAYLLGSKLFGEFADPYGAGYPLWMQWVARGVFVALFAGAFAITRHWSYIALAGIALVVGLFTYGLVRPASAAPEKKIAFVAGAAGGAAGTYRADFRANFSGGEDAVASWDFGDGGISTELNPSHTYAKPGTYKVKLAVRGDGGTGPAAKAEIDVDARPFEVTKLEMKNLRSAHGVKRPLSFEYSAKAAFGTEPYSYEWDFGSGAKATGVEGTRVFEKPGTYKVKLTATDSSPKPQEATKEVAVVASPFAVDLSVDHAGGETPAVVRFTATPYGADGEALGAEGFRFEWDFGDGEPVPNGRAETTHRYNMSDRFLAALEAMKVAAGRLERANATETPWQSMTTKQKQKAVSSELGSAFDESTGRDLDAPPSQEAYYAWHLMDEFLEGKRDSASLTEMPVRVPVKVVVKDASGGTVTESTTIHLRPPEERFPGRAALLAAIGGMLLIGGLALCVLVAMQHHREGPPGFEEEAGG
ncbi:MAG: sodium-dependent transporter [Planctomycetota bacterium]|jgi:NSS family neurotransmitter:Na+ symporter